MIARLAPYAAVGLTLLLLAMFLPTSHAARVALAIGGCRVMPLVPRAALEGVFPATGGSVPRDEVAASLGMRT